MVFADPDAHASLAEILSARARSTPSSRLLIDAIGGAVVAVVAVWGRPFAWFPLVAASVCLCSYGVWAIAERRLESPEPMSARVGFVLDTAQGVTVPIGIAAFLCLLFGVLGVAFGPVIS